jgi:hypothetical protein
VGLFISCSSTSGFANYKYNPGSMVADDVGEPRSFASKIEVGMDFEKLEKLWNSGKVKYVPS